MSLTSYLTKRLMDLLSEKRVVVWYDGEKAFGEFARAFAAPQCVKISGQESTLKARREAEEVFRRLNDSESHQEAHKNLLVYLPRKRGTNEDEKARDPFEVFAVAGTAFGDEDNEVLESLARQAMPERVEELQRLFAESRPTLSFLDGLGEAAQYPLLKETLGMDAATDVISRILCQPDSAKRVEQAAGCVEECKRLLKDEVGFEAPPRVTAWKTVLEKLGTYVLFSEFAFDQPGALPVELSAVPKAEEDFKNRIFSVCHRMRTDVTFRGAYVELAERVETELQLRAVTKGYTTLGERDTFPFEEGRYLSQLVSHARDGNLAGAREVLDGRRDSVWKYQPQRSLLWTAAERSLDLLETAHRVESTWQNEGGGLGAMVEAYTRPDGWYELDRKQRLFEHSVACCGDEGEIAPLVELCRREYLELATALQDRFLEAVRQEGWPPDRMERQTQVFDRHVGPLLSEREKVVYFMVDSLRYEMGCDLVEPFQEFGEVRTTPVAAVLPTTTLFGMAALLPNADGTFHIVEKDGDYVPALGDRRLSTSNDRMAVLREAYGDRFREVTLDDFLSKFKRLKSDLSQADLLVVRTGDPDQIAENLGGWRARKYLSGVAGDITDAARRLVQLGFTKLVLTADHGHVLVSEILAGDVVAEPPGEWMASKRRCRLGRGLSEAEGTVLLDAGHVGIRGDVEQICVPTGFKVFSTGEAYFHEGISLPEVIIPVVVVHARQATRGQGKQDIRLSSKRDKFTSHVVSVMLEYSSLFGDPVRVRVEAYDGNRRVGVAADCEALDEKTNEVVVRPGTPTPVPILLDRDFSGSSVEVRVRAAESDVIWAKLKLKNDIMD